MAKQLGSRKDGAYMIMFLFPSVEKTASNVPVPFPVTYTLGDAQNVSDDVNYNRKKAYIKGSDTKNVEGDEAGTNKGLVVQETRTAGKFFLGLTLIV